MPEEVIQLATPPLIEGPVIKKPKRDIIRRVEFEEMLSKIEDLEFKSLLCFLYIFGCRVSEALNVEQKDFRVDDKYLWVDIVVSKRHEGKLNFTHTLNVALENELVLPISKWLNSLPANYGKVWAMDRVTAWRKLKRVKGDAWLHLFRSSRLTQLAEKGANEAELMAWAGWTSIQPAGTYIQRTTRLTKPLGDSID